MKLFKLPRLKNNELQTFTEATKRIIAGVAQLSTNLAEITTAETEFLEGMQKDRNLGLNRKGLDKGRDFTYTAIIDAIDLELRYPHEDENVITALNAIQAVRNKYGKGIKTLPYEEETAELDNFIADFEKVDTSALVNYDFMRWLPLLKTDIKAFKDFSEHKIDASTEYKGVDSATIAAPKLEGALNNMFADLFANQRISPSEELQSVYNKLDTLIKIFE